MQLAVLSAIPPLPPFVVMPRVLSPCGVPSAAQRVWSTSAPHSIHPFLAQSWIDCWMLEVIMQTKVPLMACELRSWLKDIQIQRTAQKLNGRACRSTVMLSHGRKL